ncbi:MAG: hypothetical protein RJB14_988 [Pseudomonadota bacterium]
MDALVNALIAVGLLMILVMVIYLIDKVNAIEKETRKMMITLGEKSATPVPTDPFLGLSGKRLWDAMTGRSVEGLDTEGREKLRNLYQLVLSKHMEALYQDGFKDALRGLPGEPKNSRFISTAKGQIESWIPSAQANALYQCGLKAAETPQSEWGPIRASMDEAGQYLLGKTDLDNSSPLSDWLMPLSANDLAMSSADALSDPVSQMPDASKSGIKPTKL